MTDIPASLVKELREETNVGMMECKRALVEAGGDKEKAIRILRERGLAVAGKKASRVAKDGQVAAEISEGGRLGVMVEVNCETDFVARNERFQAFVKRVLETARTTDGDLSIPLKDELTAGIQEIGENIVIRRSVRYQVQGSGIIAAYIHTGGKVGVLLEVGCQKPETAQTADFKELVKDITLHIAACNPLYLQRSDVPETVINAEREIYAKQVTNKPANIVEKIVAGKLEKFFQQVCLLEQGFVKDPDQTVSELLAAKGKMLGDSIVVRRFARYKVGEEA